MGVELIQEYKCEGFIPAFSKTATLNCIFKCCNQPMLCCLSGLNHWDREDPTRQNTEHHALMFWSVTKSDIWLMAWTKWVDEQISRCDNYDSDEELPFYFVITLPLSFVPSCVMSLQYKYDFFFMPCIICSLISNSCLDLVLKTKICVKINNTKFRVWGCIWNQLLYKQ